MGNIYKLATVCVLNMGDLKDRFQFGGESLDDSVSEIPETPYSFTAGERVAVSESETPHNLRFSSTSMMTVPSEKGKRITFLDNIPGIKLRDFLQQKYAHERLATPKYEPKAPDVLVTEDIMKVPLRILNEGRRLDEIMNVINNYLSLTGQGEYSLQLGSFELEKKFSTQTVKGVGIIKENNCIAAVPIACKYKNPKLNHLWSTLGQYVNLKSKRIKLSSD